MKFSPRFSRNLAFAALLSLVVSGCSPSTAYVSQEGITGGLLGAATGTAAGWLIGEQVGKRTENIALGAALGSAMGLMGGAWINEQNIKLARKRELVIREATLVNKQQRELDLLREEVYDASSLGGNEVRPWDQRYWDEDPSLPYQGLVHP